MRIKVFEMMIVKLAKVIQRNQRELAVKIPGIYTVSSRFVLQCPVV